MLDHYADAVFSEPGRCWRGWITQYGAQPGRPDHCEEPVVWVGFHHLSGPKGKKGKRIRVWSCEGRREGVEWAEVA
jgi:hypothetical protein